MIDISSWMTDFMLSLEENFGDRVWFVGLQGSYGRGEAGDTSDIDVVIDFETMSQELFVWAKS